MLLSHAQSVAIGIGRILCFWCDETYLWTSGIWLEWYCFVYIQRLNWFHFQLNNVSML